MSDDPFGTNHDDNGHRVVDEKGETVLACSDEQSATRYAVLLNQTYRAGYKSGYRDAKRGVCGE